jgi:hypothetical protein
MAAFQTHTFTVNESATGKDVDLKTGTLPRIRGIQ